MAEAMTRPKKGQYGVKLVRGPFVRLAQNVEECHDEEAFLAYAARLRGGGARLAADLFSGAGGLSLGLEAAGYRVVFAADRDPEAVETHRHHFGGFMLNWDLGKPEHIAAIARLMSEAKVELLAGGPPCQPFSRAGRNKIRHRVRSGFSDPSEERRDLWRSYLEVIKIAKPPAVVMENVPDMVLDQEMFILRTIVHELEELGYAVEERLVDTSRYGVPQFRQRLILVALRDGKEFRWPAEVPDKVTVWNAIGDLPSVEGGWRPEGGADGWKPYGGPVSTFQRRMRQGVDPAHADRVYDQITRPVREDDKLAFQMMDANTLYSDLPDDVKRYRDDIFDDKYKRLAEDGLSRTITAHIAKDGYWYIHPRDNRTLTVREAARLQTFPDWYRFAGPPSAAFRQIGNAVPPAFGEHIGRAVQESLGMPRDAAPFTHVIASALAGWYRGLDQPSVFWLRTGNRWRVVAAELLFERLASDVVRRVWPVIAGWDEPRNTLKAGDGFLNIARSIDREARARRLLKFAEELQDSPERLADDQEIRRALQGNEAIADLAVLAVPVDQSTSAGPDDAEEEGASEEPVIASRGVLRVAARFTGEQVDRRNRMSDGRLAVARMIGYGSDARDAHLGLVELAASVCRPDAMACDRCPLDAMCAEPRPQRQDALF
jgi:DNA (cytosine-5)-methyltransferase 1